MVLKTLLSSSLRATRQFSIWPFGMTVKENNLQTYFNERFKKLYDSTDEVVFMDGDRYNIPKRKMILLNRLKALNALNLPMVRTMYKQMLEWQDSLQIQMVIIKGAGEKAFCAGGDVLAVTKSAKEGIGTYHKDFFREEYKLNYLIGTYSVPVISFMDGITMGGGCGIALNGMYRVATEKTLLAMPETALGLFPDVGGSYFLTKLKGNLGMFLALTGYRLKGADIYHAGLATNYVESSKVQELIIELINNNDATNDFVIYSMIEAREPKNIPPFSLEPHLGTIEKCFDGDSVEDIIKKLEADGSEFARKQVVELKKMSPTSLKVTFRQLKEGAKMSFEEIFNMEYRLTQRFMKDHDFHEGCRAILIDKDRNPKWKPSKLEEVKQEKIDWYFSPFENPNDELIIHRPLYARHWSKRWDILMGEQDPQRKKNKPKL